MFNQIIPVANPQDRGWPTTSRAIQVINILLWLLLWLLLWAGLSASQYLWPGLATVRASANERSATQSAQEGDSLEPGKPVERETSGGQSHFYKVTMSSGQYLHIAVRQREIDVVVALFTPDGKKISE